MTETIEEAVERLHDDIRKEVYEINKENFISWEDQWKNIKERWKVHLKEWSILSRQVKTLGKEARVWVEARREDLKENWKNSEFGSQEEGK